MHLKNRDDYFLGEAFVEVSGYSSFGKDALKAQLVFLYKKCMCHEPYIIYNIQAANRSK